MSAVKRRKQKLGAGDRAFNIVLGGLTAVSVVVILYPLIFVLVASISDPMEIFQGNVWLWPKGFNLEAYKQVFRNGDIFTGYKNTLIYTVVGTLVTIIITFSAAYPLSRKKLYGRSKLMGFFLFTMFFSGGMICTIPTAAISYIMAGIWTAIPARISTGRPPPSTRSSLGTFITRHLWTIC